MNRLETLAQSTSNNAKKSFKPLLDNTNEVRKVQSALAVLQRVGPLLQVPSLMRQHIENGRFSAAVSTYRRALIIDDNNKIKLLHHVKQKAAEAARDARVDLEKRLANPNLPVHVSDFNIVQCLLYKRHPIFLTFISTRSIHRQFLIQLKVSVSLLS